MEYIPDSIGLTKVEMDITDEKSIMEAIKRCQPECIINCAAITNINMCEEYPDKAYMINVFGAKTLAKIAQQEKIKLIHLSSNYVINPVNEYSWSKLLGEIPVKHYGGVIIRTTYYTKDYWMFEKFKKKEKFNVSIKNKFNPISAMGLAEAINTIIKKDIKGTINIGTTDCINYYEFAMKIARIFGYDASLINPVEDIQFKVKRPDDVYLELDDNFTRGINIYSIEEDLNQYKKD